MTFNTSKPQGSPMVRRGMTPDGSPSVRRGNNAPSKPSKSGKGKGNCGSGKCK